MSFPIRDVRFRRNFSLHQGNTIGGFVREEISRGGRFSIYGPTAVIVRIAAIRDGPRIVKERVPNSCVFK